MVRAQGCALFAAMFFCCGICLLYTTVDTNSVCLTPLMARRTKKKWNGPLQYEDPSKHLMMLPTDMARLAIEYHLCA